MPGVATLPASEETSTTWPLPRSTMAGTRALASWIGARRLTARARSISSVVNVSSLPLAGRPALATKTSTPVARSASRSTSSALARSAAITSAGPPRAPGARWKDPPIVEAARRSGGEVGDVGRRRLRDLLLAALTAVAGATDALSYLGLGQVFTANMTGNLVLLGVGAGRGGGAEVGRSAAAFVAFAVGVVLATRLVARREAEELWP